MSLYKCFFVHKISLHVHLYTHDLYVFICTQRTFTCIHSTPRFFTIKCLDVHKGLFTYMLFVHKGPLQVYLCTKDFYMFMCNKGSLHVLQ